MKSKKIFQMPYRESAFLSLSPDFVIEDDNSIYDRIMNIRHKFSPPAFDAIRKFQQPIAYRHWLTAAINHGLSDSNINKLLTYLNDIGALELDFKSNIYRLKFTLKNLFGLNPVVSRNRIGLLGIISIVSVVCAPLLLLAILTLFLAIIFGGYQQFSLFYCAIFIFLIWLSTVVHEFAHIFFARRAVASMVLVRRGLRLGLLHPFIGARLELFSAVAGPAAGAIFVILISVFLGAAMNDPVILFLGYISAICHLVSLLPFFGDGSAITKYWVSRGPSI